MGVVGREHQILVVGRREHVLLNSVHGLHKRVGRS
jgi:hypothetical protein